MTIAPPTAPSSERPPRFSMLELLRGFALEKLELRPDADAVRARHAACFAATVERAEAGLTAAGADELLDRLEREHANVRAALRFALARLLGAADTLRRSIGVLLGPYETRVHEHAVETTRALLGDAAFAASWKEGSELELDDVADRALAALAPEDGAAVRAG